MPVQISFFHFARDPETGKYGVEVEEGYLTTLSLPARLQLKVGKIPKRSRKSEYCTSSCSSFY